MCHVKHEDTKKEKYSKTYNNVFFRQEGIMIYPLIPEDSKFLLDKSPFKVTLEWEEKCST